MPDVMKFMTNDERNAAAERMESRAKELEDEALAECDRVLKSLRRANSLELPDFGDACDPTAFTDLFFAAAEVWADAYELRVGARELREGRD
jgi:hypothetical protein